MECVEGEPKFRGLNFGPWTTETSKGWGSSEKLSGSFFEKGS